MRVLCVHAHFDDFEFVAAGTFELLRRRALPDFRARVIVCTDGRAGDPFPMAQAAAAEIHPAHGEIHHLHDVSPALAADRAGVHQRPARQQAGALHAVLPPFAIAGAGIPITVAAGLG